MKRFFLFSILFLIIINSCEDNNQIDLETKLINILNSDDISGIDGFDTNGDMELNFETGLDRKSVV